MTSLSKAATTHSCPSAFATCRCSPPTMLFHVFAAQEAILFHIFTSKAELNNLLEVTWLRSNRAGTEPRTVRRQVSPLHHHQPGPRPGKPQVFLGTRVVRSSLLTTAFHGDRHRLCLHRGTPLICAPSDENHHLTEHKDFSHQPRPARQSPPSSHVLLGGRPSPGQTHRPQAFWLARGEGFNSCGGGREIKEKEVSIPPYQRKV